MSRCAFNVLHHSLDVRGDESVDLCLVRQCAGPVVGAPSCEGAQEAVAQCQLSGGSPELHDLQNVAAVIDCADAPI